MDPLTAFGLAANVLQFIDFTSKLFVLGMEIYRVGESVRNLNLGLVVDDLNSLSLKLKNDTRPLSSATPSEDDKAWYHGRFNLSLIDLLRRFKFLQINALQSPTVYPASLERSMAIPSVVRNGVHFAKCC